MLVTSLLRSVASFTLALGVALLSLGACVPPPSAPPVATQTPASEVLPTGSQEPAVPAVTRTPRPLPTLVANVPIEINGGNIHATITPRHTVRVFTTDSPLQITVRYPGPVADREPSVRIVQPFTVRWLTETTPPPDSNTFAFSVAGSDAGIFTVEVTASGYAPVRFSVQASVPVAGATPAAQVGATVITGTAVPSLGGPLGATTVTPASPIASPQTVTLSNDQATITMHVGDRFLLSLGEEYDWTASPSDPAVVSRVVNVLTVRGSQGLYEAHQVGQTALTAAGDPTCRKAQPPCMTPSRQFQVQIIVQ